MDLDEEQEKIFNKIKEGKNVVIMGSGGTGKSFLIKEVRRRLKNKNVGITAMTGIAAININGETIHHYAGLGILNKDDYFYINKLKNNSLNSVRFRSTDILIIDEFSMMSKYFFEKMMRIFNSVNKLQIILSGDPKQLKPVFTKWDEDDKKKFCFESKIYEELFKDNIFVLKKNHRQKDDYYVKNLEKIGMGILEDEFKEEIKKKIKPINRDLDIVHLYNSNQEVFEHNDYRYKKLKTKEYVYKFEDSVEPIREDCDYFDKISLLEKLEKYSRFKDDVKVKKDCYVMCLLNIDIDSGWANGTCGWIVDFFLGYPLICKNENKKNEYKKDRKKFLMGEILEGLPLIKNNDLDFLHFMPMNVDIYENKIGKAIRTGVPLTLAYARTVHKTQGCEMDNIYITTSKMNMEGQIYVAMSRVKSMDGLNISGIPIVRYNDKAIEYIKKYI